MTCQSDNQGSILNLAFVLLLVVIIGTVATGHCQELPDAPQPQITQRCRYICSTKVKLGLEAAFVWRAP